MWFPIALLGNGLLALVGILDKFIITKSVPKPVVFVFYSTIFVLPLFLLLPFGLTAAPKATFDYLVFAVSGGCFALGLWAMYTALEKIEVSRVGPLIGAGAPFFILFLSRIFLGEKLSLYALLGALLLIIGCLVISFEKKGQTSIGQGGLWWALLAGLFFAISHVSAKYVYDLYGFFDGFVFTKLPVGIFGAALLLDSDVRAIFNKKQKPVAGQPPKKSQLLLVAGDMLLGVIATIFLQYAMSLGSVTLVNALAGVQYALLIIFTALIAKFFPNNILKEKFTLSSVIRKSIAVSVIAFGLVLLIIK
jgi:drug/metabolite transporter (DMT)-like permease